MIFDDACPTSSGRPVSCEIGHPYFWSPRVTDLTEKSKILVILVPIFLGDWGPRVTDLHGKMGTPLGIWSPPMELMHST